MRFQSLAVFAFLLALCLASAPGCEVYNTVTKEIGIRSPPPFVIHKDVVPQDFKLNATVVDFASPPTDYTVEFERSGKATYEVTVRAPRRRQQAGNFEINEDQVLALWKAVAEVEFDKLALRYPAEGTGTDKTQGVQKYYVQAEGIDRRVESHFQANAALDKVRAAIVAVVPKDIMDARDAPGSRNSPVEYIGDTTTHLFHLPDCPQLKDVPAQRRQSYSVPWDALDHGFQPCPDCAPMRTKTK